MDITSFLSNHANLPLLVLFTAPSLLWDPLASLLRAPISAARDRDRRQNERQIASADLFLIMALFFLGAIDCY